MHELVATATAAVATEDAVSVATEAGDKQKPDNPFATATIVAAKDTVSTTTIIAGVVAVAEEQNQDNPNPAAAPTSVISCICASAIVVATTVSSCQVTHFFVPPKVYLCFILCMGACQCFYREENKFFFPRYG